MWGKKRAPGHPWGMPRGLPSVPEWGLSLCSMPSPGPSSTDGAGGKSTSSAGVVSSLPMTSRSHFPKSTAFSLQVAAVAVRCRAVEHPAVGGKHQHGGIPGRRPITRQGVPSSKPRDRRTTTPRASRETPLSSPPARDGAEGGGGTSRSSNGEDGAERRRRQRRSIRMLAPGASQCSPSVNPQRPRSARRPRHKANVDSLGRK